MDETPKLLAGPDITGEIGPTSDFYWGCRWKSLRARCIDTAHKLVHYPGTSQKRRIFHLGRLAAKMCRRMDLDPTHTVFRQVCTAELVDRHWVRREPEPCNRMRILIIGDGAGILSGLLKEMFPSSSIVLVDIGKSLLYQAYHCQKANPGLIHMLAEEDTDTSQADFLYCPTENLHTLEKLEFDVAINIASMQEMNSGTIDRYFDFLRRRLKADNLFYCCNRESKTLIGGEISKFHNYPWHPNDTVLLEGEPTWHRYIVGKPLAQDGPNILGVRIPYMSYYDGVILHRLTVLATGEGSSRGNETLPGSHMTEEPAS